MAAAPKPVEEMSGAEVATEIRDRLKTLERDREWNEYIVPARPRPAGDTFDGMYPEQRLSHLFMSGASHGGGKVHITFISYQGGSNWDVDQARDYLTYLREGNRGRIYEARRAGAVRASKAETLRDRAKAAAEVAYEHRDGTWGSKVYAAVDVPDDARMVVAAEDVQVGDKVWWGSKWRTVEETREFVPPMPEDAQGKAEELKNAILMGDYDKANGLTYELTRITRQLGEGREFEAKIMFKGGAEPLTATPECRVAVRRPRGR